MGESLRFGRQFQVGVLRLILADATFASKCFKYLQDNYFESEELSWFYSNFKNHYEEYNRLPDDLTITSDIQSKISGEEVDMFFSVAREIQDQNVGNAEYIKKHIEKYVKACMYRETWAVSKDYFNKEQLESAYNYTQERVDEIQAIDFFGDNLIDVDNLESILANLHVSNENKIRTNMPPLDELLVGGLPRQSITTVMAGYNVGKTIFLINLAVEAARNNHRVLFIFHEGRGEQILARFLSKISEISFKYLLNKNDTNNEHKVPRYKLEEARAFMKKFIMVKPMVEVGTSVEDVYAYVKEKNKEQRIDVVISDYAQRLELKKSYKEFRHNMAKIWQMLSQMAMELNMCVITAAQFNREGVKTSKGMKRVVRSEMVSECVDIAQISETILTLNPFVNGSMVVCLDKQRDGKTGVLIKCRVDWDTIRMWDRDLEITEISPQEFEDHYDPEGIPEIKETNGSFGNTKNRNPLPYSDQTFEAPVDSGDYPDSWDEDDQEKGNEFSVEYNDEF